MQYDNGLRDNVNVTRKIIDVSRWYTACFDVTYCVMCQGITSRFIERRINSISVDHAKQICFVALFCSHVKQKAMQCLMNTEFHATLRTGIIIDMSNTQSMDQTRC